MFFSRLQKIVFGLFVVLATLGLSHPLWGQAVSGTLLGTVTDATGASVVQAKVAATESATNIRYESETNASGNYAIPNLKPGTYVVTVELKGFKKSTHENIELLSNTSQRVDFSLATGSVTETITVTEAPPELQTDRADISTKLEAKVVTDMPLGTGHNFQTLLNLVPGVAPVTFQSSQFFNAASTLQTQVNGLPREQNVYQIEGVDDNERTGQLQMIVLPPDAIASVDISTNNYEAELGRATGAVVNVTMKSGSNKFHGSAYESNQNNSFAARTYFQTTPNGHLSYNYFGGSLSGAIVKDKLFVFGNFLKSIDHERGVQITTVADARYFTPTLGLAGCSDSQGCIDLSGAMNGAKGQIYDPTTGNGLKATTAGGTPRTKFAGNLLPYSRVNSVSLTIMKDVLAAAQLLGTLTPTVSMYNPTNNYTQYLPFQKTGTNYNVKVDYALSERDHFSGRYSNYKSVVYQAPSFGSFLGGPAGGGFEGNGLQNVYSTGINYDHVFTPSFFTEVRVGVAHLSNVATTADYGSNDATTIGIPGVNLPNNPFTSGQATINLGSTFSLMGYASSQPWIRDETNFDAVNNWTKIHGNHTFKWGADVRRIHDDILQDQLYGARGVFNFASGQTSDASSAGDTLANNVASLLLDLPNSTGRDVNTYFPRYQQWWVFLFAADKWQVSPKLTLDLGLRWEFYPPGTPKDAGAFSNYNPTNNTLVIAGVGGNPMNLGMQTRYNYFAPRTGLSYRLRESTVVRLGAGISYAPIPDNTYAYNYPVRSNNGYTSLGIASSYTAAQIPCGATSQAACPTGYSTYNGINYTNATFQIGFPAPVPVPVPSNGIIAVTGNANLTSSQMAYIPLNYKNPHAINWNVAVQQALPWNLSAQLAYVANHGIDMDSGLNINQAPYYGGGNNSLPENYDPQGNLTFGRTVATTESFVPYSSNYQSLQAELTKRASQGLSFTSGFTWGKGLNYITGDDSGIVFFINQRRNYAPVDWDRKFNFEQTFSYELPFGRGHRFLNSTIADAVVGGWRLTGMISIVTGTPFTVTANGNTLNTPGTTQTATLNGSFTKLKGIGTTSPWFKNDLGTLGSSATWQQPLGCASTGFYGACLAPGLGNTGRNQFRGPGYVQDNASLAKRFAIYREASLEARIDAFQLSNTPQFSSPNGSITSSTFGQITGTLGSGSGYVNGVGGGRTFQGGLKLTF